VDAAPAEERVEQRLLPQLACGGSWFFRPAGREGKILVAISTGFVSFYMIECGKDETDWCYKTLWFEGRKEGKV
jgi:hypothetical protein